MAKNNNFEYTYLGDKLTDLKWKNLKCKAIRRPNGKCIRSKMSTMLVLFDNGELNVVLARRLRKIK